jgi:2'-5' RNA ligase
MTSSLVRFVHHSTIAIVPPSAATDAWIWDRCQGTRYKLRDRGYYRWPPHCNLIYPFIDPDSVGESLLALKEAAASIPPFRITLSSLDTFGGYNRGVLWLDPVVSDGKLSSIYDLQSSLTLALRSVHGDDLPLSSRFTPHMTLCHYPTLTAARAGAAGLAAEWAASPVSFDVREVYVLERRGDGGQFRVAHRLPLHGVGEGDEHSPFCRPLCGDSGDSGIGGDGEGGGDGGGGSDEGDTMRFPFMPVEEEAWVREVRGEHKEGRRSARGRVNPPRTQDTEHASGLASGHASEQASGQASRRASGRAGTEESRRPTTDTPEQIAAKRALRAAKRTAAATLLLTTAGTLPCDSQVLRLLRELRVLRERAIWPPLYYCCSFIMHFYCPYSCPYSCMLL